METIRDCSDHCIKSPRHWGQDSHPTIFQIVWRLEATSKYQGIRTIYPPPLKPVSQLYRKNSMSGEIITFWENRMVEIVVLVEIVTYFLGRAPRAGRNSVW